MKGTVFVVTDGPRQLAGEPPDILWAVRDADSGALMLFPIPVAQWLESIGHENAKLALEAWYASQV